MTETDRDKPRIGRWRRFVNRVEMLWRARVRRWWHDFQWTVILIVALVAVALGCWGFAQLPVEPGKPARTWLGILYLTLQLFTLESGAVQGHVSLPLQAARWLAPGVAAYAAVQALVVILQEQIDSLRLRWRRGHCVICGLGHKGLLLAQGLLDKGERVVVLEQDEANGKIGQCRSRGAIVLLGDAADWGWLRKAAAHRAKYVISVCGDDAANAEVASYARELAKNREGNRLTCLIHITSPQLFRSMRKHNMASRQDDCLRLEFFNVFDSETRRLLSQYPVFGEGCVAVDEPPHLLVVGLGQMGDSLVHRAVERWQLRHKATGQRLRITVIDATARRWEEAWRASYPDLQDACELNVRPMDVASPDLERAELPTDVTMVYVCLDDEAAGLSATLSLSSRYAEPNVPVVVCAAEEAGLATLLGAPGGGTQGYRNLRVFGVLDRTRDPGFLPNGTYEVLARLFHLDFMEFFERKGDTPEKRPAMRPWGELPEVYRESNRLEAEHVLVKLRAVGCTLGPLVHWNAESFQFSDDEVETMARMEHERWMVERFLGGWVYGEIRDEEGQTNPDLIPWDKLPEGEKKYNRETIRGYPSLLAKAGFEIYRQS
ncbi:MAG TPA: NAD-binding protein [Thermoguttaceae bacterium]|nr:NAD-binding protein [Thermoguttaceae bacterium]